MNTPSRHSPPPPATTLAAGRYLILRELGSGGMGVVYLCEDSELGRQVAVKTLVRSWRSSKEVVSMFLSEARALAGLDHPGLVRVHDVLAEEEAGERVPYLVMEYIQGQSLESLISERSLSLSETLYLLAEVAAALAYCHGRGLLHRDVKPGNILVTAGDASQSGDGRRRAKLIDFGIARSLSTLAQRGTELRGTPAYMAPEQVLGGRLSPATDLYALGVTIYEAVSGQLPFTDGQVMAQHVYGKPPLLRHKAPGIPRSLERLVMRCLAKEPSERPTDCTELRDGLLRIASELLPSDDVATRVSPIRATERRPPGLAAPRRDRRIVAGFGLAFLGLATWLWLRRSEQNPAQSAAPPGYPAAASVPSDGAAAASAPEAALVRDLGLGLGMGLPAGQPNAMRLPDAGEARADAVPDGGGTAAAAGQVDTGAAPPVPRPLRGGQDAGSLGRGSDRTIAPGRSRGGSEEARQPDGLPRAAPPQARPEEAAKATPASGEPSPSTAETRPDPAPKTQPSPPPLGAREPATPPTDKAPPEAAPRSPPPAAKPPTPPSTPPKVIDVPLSF